MRRGRRRFRPRSRGPSFAVRLLVVAMGLVVVVGSGFVLDRAVGRRVPAASRNPLSSGAWFCPHGGSSSWKGWVVVTNPGRRPVDVRLTTFGSTGRTAERSFSIPAQRQMFTEVPVSDAGAATEVEYFGGWVGAASVVSGGKGHGLASSECQASSRKSWLLLDEPTGQSETGYAVVMNPFFAAAEFDVIIRTPRRTVRPSVLTPFVLSGRRSVAIKVNKYALEAPGEETVTVEIVARIGRVVAGSLGVVPGGIRSEGGIPPEKRWIMPAAASDPSTLSVVNPGTLVGTISVTAQEKSSEQPLFEQPRLRLAPGQVRAEDLGKVQGAGLVVSTDGSSIGAVAVTSGEKTDDTATIGGVHRSGRAWLVLPGSPPDGGRELLVLQNPARTAASVTLSYIGDAGPVTTNQGGSIQIPAGRTVTIEVPPGPTGEPVSVVVKAETGNVAAAETSYSSDDAGYAASLGVPM